MRASVASTHVEAAGLVLEVVNGGLVDSWDEKVESESSSVSANELESPIFGDGRTCCLVVLDFLAVISSWEQFDRSLW